MSGTEKYDFDSWVACTWGDKCPNHKKITAILQEHKDGIISDFICIVKIRKLVNFSEKL